MKRKKSDDGFAPKRTSNALSADVYSKRKQYRRKRKTTAFAIVFSSVIAAAVIALLIVSFMKIGVVANINLEAGDALPEPSAFFEDKEVNAAFVTKRMPDTSLPGKYKLRVRNGILIYDVTLTVEDTVAPTAKVIPVSIRRGERTVDASEFVRDVEDKTQVDVTLSEPIDYSQNGDRAVTVILKDAGGNETEYTSRLTIYPPEIVPTYTIEAGSLGYDIKNFLKEGTEPGEGDCIEDEFKSVPLNTVAENKIRIIYGGVTYTVTLNVEDTQAPAAYIINRSTYLGVEIPADSFVKKIYDQTTVKITYKETPDFGKEGKQIVTIVLRDEGGNKKSYDVTLTVDKDKTPPVITAANRTVYIGDNIRFSEGVTAIDANDGEVKFKVNADGFDKTKPGRYPITFTAKDKAGNKAERTVWFTLKEKQSDTVSQYVIDSAFEKLYNGIIDNGMTEKQKIQAIYDYERENIAYNGTSDKTDWQQEAYRGITDKQGDAFTFYAVARKLLTMAKIENEGVRRKDAQSSHYWNKIKYDGKWYHFDACPHYKDFPLDSVMLTEDEIKAYSQKTNGYYYEYETIKGD